MILRRICPFLVISFWGMIVLPSWANAMTPLTRAEIQNLRNIVQLIPIRQRQRPARRADPMNPGDRLSTGRASLADLRFNDGSLARVGEQAVFRFLPQSRNFTLSNGTMLLLIPPGRGQTRIQTPNAAAAIRGSALFVRYDENTDTTVVGALTNSGIEVFNQKASQNQLLEAGQLMVIVKGEFQGLYDFDLRTFYETSDLVRGLNLDQLDIDDTSDPAISSVKAETTAAVAKQLPVNGEKVIDNPSFLQLSPNFSNSANPNRNTDISPAETINNRPINTFRETGEILSDTISDPESPNNENDNPPGLGNDNPPGLENDNPPGLENDNPPGLENDNPPGLENDNPPGLENNNPPGLENNNPPGLENNNPPGLVDNPALGNTPPGLVDNPAPGLINNPPPPLP